MRAISRSKIPLSSASPIALAIAARNVSRGLSPAFGRSSFLFFQSILLPLFVRAANRERRPLLLLPASLLPSTRSASGRDKPVTNHRHNSSRVWRRDQRHLLGMSVCELRQGLRPGLVSMVFRPNEVVRCWLGVVISANYASGVYGVRRLRNIAAATERPFLVRKISFRLCWLPPVYLNSIRPSPGPPPRARSARS
jgi:hypothetical protein